MADPVAVYANLGTRFGVVDAEHPGGHHGQDFRLPGGGGSEVVAYEECVVVESGTEVTRGFTAILGWYVVARSKRDGKYMGWAHLRRGTRPDVGTVLRPGDRVGLAASGPRPAKNLAPTEAGINYPGTAWAGAHIHTTLSTTITGIFAGPTWDPLPRIQAALFALAGSGELAPVVPATKPKPAPVPPPAPAPAPIPDPLGDDMPTRYFRSTTGTIGAFGGVGQKVRTFGSPADYITHRESLVALAKTATYGPAFASGALVIPPDINNAALFVTLDARHWEIEVALCGGYA